MTQFDAHIAYSARFSAIFAKLKEQNRLTVQLPSGMNNATIRISNLLRQFLYSQPATASQNSITTNALVPGGQVINDNKIVFKNTIVKN